MYHIFTWITSEDNSYVYYLFFLISSLLFSISYSFAYHNNIPLIILGFELGFWASAFMMPIIQLSMFLMTREFIGFKKTSLFSSSIYVLPALSFIGFIGIIVSGHSIFLHMLRFNSLLHVLLLPAISLFSWYKDRSEYKASFFCHGFFL